jgi:hypothetical protein
VRGDNRQVTGPTSARCRVIVHAAGAAADVGRTANAKLSGDRTMNLNGATAMVTGGSSGIGLAIAKTTDFYATAGLDLMCVSER